MVQSDYVESNHIGWKYSKKIFLNKKDVGLYNCFTHRKHKIPFRRFFISFSICLACIPWINSPGATECQLCSYFHHDT